METRSYNFSSITMADLESIVDIRMGDDEDYDHKFDEWFGFRYTLDESENELLERLIKRHKKRLPKYSEEKLKMRFLAFILDKVDFMTDTIQDWYNSTLTGMVNGVKIGGFTDFMVATGTEQPQKPYFFIQEFKPSKPDIDPEVQLLAEMLVALEKNQKTKLHGSYIIGQNWKFVILEKKGENKFQYFVSEQLDSLKIEELKQIYINLQAVKQKYCVD